MSAAQRASLIQHALDLGHMFRQNMAIKHGLPEPSSTMFPVGVSEPPQPLTLRVETNQPLATATATAAGNPAGMPAAQAQAAPVATAADPAATPTVPAGTSDWVKRAAIAAAVIGTGGLGAGATYLLTRPSSGNTGPTINVQAADQSLLTWLQERGYHLPPGRPTGPEKSK